MLPSHVAVFASAVLFLLACATPSTKAVCQPGKSFDADTGKKCPVTLTKRDTRADAKILKMRKHKAAKQNKRTIHHYYTTAGDGVSPNVSVRGQQMRVLAVTS